MTWLLPIAYPIAGLLLALHARAERVSQGLWAFLTRPALRHAAQLREVGHDLGPSVLIMFAWPLWLLGRWVLAREARASGNRHP